MINTIKKYVHQAKSFLAVWCGESIDGVKRGTILKVICIILLVYFCYVGVRSIIFNNYDPYAVFNHEDLHHISQRVQRTRFSMRNRNTVGHNISGVVPCEETNRVRVWLVVYNEEETERFLHMMRRTRRIRNLAVFSFQQGDHAVAQ